MGSSSRAPTVPSLGPSSGRSMRCWVAYCMLRCMRRPAIYYVYGNRDPGTGRNRLAIRRITTDAVGDPIVGAESFVIGLVDAALPSVAVTPNGTVGVFHYTFDGFDSSDFPIFTARLALSTNRGATFTDTPLLTFVSSARDNGNSRQRV